MTSERIESSQVQILVIIVNRQTFIYSIAASKIIDALQTSNEITLEAWIQPGNNTQDGPARIVTLSSDGSASNFTLGQGRWWPQPSELYTVNLRTTHTSDEGLPATITPNGTLTTNLTHVVYTRDTDSIARIYIDGVETAIRTVGGDFSNWDPSYPLSLAGEITGEFPWIGELQLLAIYSRALSLEEVDQNFQAGPSDGGDVDTTPDNDDLFGYDYEISTNPAAPHADMTTQLGAVVHREGGKQVLENLEVGFYQGDPDEDGTLIGNAVIERLPPRSSAISSEVAWIPPSSGAYTIFAVIDPNNDVPESDESNNVLNRIITVLEPAPDQVAPHVDCFTINNGVPVTEIPAVTLEACASDPEPGTGVQDMLFVEYEYQNDVGEWVVVQISDWLEYITTPSTYPWALTLASGVRYFQAWARDGASNISLYPYQSFINYVPPIDSVAQGEGHVYRYTWNEGDLVTVRLEPVSGDPDLYVWAPDYDEGRPPWVSNLSGNSVDTVSFTAPVDGVYQVEVYGYTDAEYRLLVDAVPMATSAHVLESVGGIDSDKPQYSEPIVPLDSIPKQTWPPPNLPDQQHVVYLPFVGR